MRLVQGENGIYGNLYSLGEFDRTNTYPFIIMSHSANVNSDTLNSYAQRSAALGYLVYTFDFPGSGSSRSDAVENSTIFTQMDTLRFLVDYFAGQSYASDIYLFGTSQGGLVSAVVADEKDAAVSGLILLYPAFNIPELMSKFPIGVDPEYKKQLEEHNVFDHIGSFSGDVLILHGTSDIMVPSSYSEKAAELYSSCRLELISGANHGFNRENYAFNDKYDGVTWDYIEQYLLRHKEQ
ncbi:MAG: alpha/beta fold hydrolase [Firmicutes bacterium]|nr:alpha/beta fold hydrolase [Bacillota bacterium]